MGRHAVILAGGKGSRLAPYTTVLPKPLLPVGDRAILEIVVEQLRLAGFTDLTFAVGYLAHLIQAVFGDGSGHGVRISYHQETEPLGTAGALGALELEGAVLVMNGDVLTSLDYKELFEAHQASGNLLTVASHRRVVRDDYGVIQVDGGDGQMRPIVGYLEKPEHEYLVSMGVYVIDASIKAYLPRSERFDIPDLVFALLAAGEPVGSYASGEYWLDIGRHDDYEKANVEIERMLPRLLNSGKR